MSESERADRHSSTWLQAPQARLAGHPVSLGMVRVLLLIVVGAGLTGCSQEAVLFKPNPRRIPHPIRQVPRRTHAQPIDGTSAPPKCVIIRGDEAMPAHEVVQSPASRKIAEEWQRLSPEERQAILAEWRRRTPPAQPKPKPGAREDTACQSYAYMDSTDLGPLTFLAPMEGFQMVSGVFRPKKGERPPPGKPPHRPRPRPRPPWPPRPIPRPRPPRPGPPPRRPGKPPIIIIRPIDGVPVHAFLNPT